MLDRASVGSLGPGPIQQLIHSAAIPDWTWDHLCSTFLLDQSSMTRVLFVMPGGTKSLEIFVKGKLSVAGHLSLSATPCFCPCQGKRQKVTASILTGGVWNGFLRGPYPLLVVLRESPEFTCWISRDKSLP